MEILSQYEIPVAKGGIAVSPEAAIKIARSIGYPVVVKAISEKVTHKSEAKAVKLDVKDDKYVARAYQEVMDNVKKYDAKADVTGVLIQETIKDGIEVIVGISRDSQFGPVVLFGLGGVLVEVQKDVSIRVAPINHYDADEMVREISGYKILEGFRGRPAADIKAITDILLKVSKLSIDKKETVLELDLNPLIVQPAGKGAKAVDARFVVSKATDRPR